MFLEISQEPRFFWHTRKHTQVPLSLQKKNSELIKTEKSKLIFPVFQDFKSFIFLSWIQFIIAYLINLILITTLCSKCCKKKKEIYPVPPTHVSATYSYSEVETNSESYLFLFCGFWPWMVLFFTNPTCFHGLQQPKLHCLICWIS